MVDIESYIFTRIYEAVTARYPEAQVLGDYIEELAKFPTVTVTEIGNATVRRMQDEEPVEHYVTVTYEINIYSNERLNKKGVNKDILNIIDGVMFPMKFTRGLTRRLPAIDHSRTVYRMYSRYTAVVDEGTVNGDTITFQMYRT